MIQVTPNTIGSARVDPVSSDFDILVYQHGVDVVVESAVKCPCKMDGRGYNVSCKNCGGSGWMFINPIQTRMVLQSMNMSTKYKEWSQERIGMVNITVRTVDSIGDMDRITVLNTTSIMSQVVAPKIGGGDNFIAQVSYPIFDVVDIFKYNSESSKHTLLSKDIDYTYVVGKNFITLDSNHIGDDVSISVRYKHPIQYYVVDMPREISQVTVAVDGAEVKNNFPTSIIARRCHYVLRPESYNNESALFDNSYR